MFQECIAQAAIQADAHRDILIVHQLDERVELFGRLMQPDPRMNVDVDHGKLRPGQPVLLDPQHRARSKLIECQVMAVATVERLGRVGARRRFLFGWRTIWSTRLADGHGSAAAKPAGSGATGQAPCYDPRNRHRRTLG